MQDLRWRCEFLFICLLVRARQYWSLDQWLSVCLGESKAIVNLGTQCESFSDV